MAKMIQRGVNIYIDQQDAERAIEALQVKFDSLNKKIKELESSGKKGNNEWNKTTQELKKTDAALSLVSKELKVTEMSMSQLRSISARLQNQLNKAKPNTPEWEQYSATLAEVRGEMTRLNAKQRDTENAFLKTNNIVREHQNSMTKLANSFNKYQALAVGFIASVTGIAFAIKNVINEYAKLDDAYANVSKNTGLTIAEVKELDKVLKGYNTRTTREELLKLASDAGKAGETGVQNLNGIVRELDKIKVALGEDLGEDAISDLLTIANVSGLRDLMGTADAINAIGSAVNELGQASIAKEAYIISFSQRLGGVAASARISAQDIMGIASALNQTGQQVEMSSTAIQQFIVKMMSEPAKFAKIAGLEVKGFTQLVAKDTNEAMIEMLEAMNAKGGFQAMIPMFEDMGTEGVRAISVLSSLAKRIDSVKEAQALSNKAFTEATSIQDEFDKKNNNAQAELEKSRNKFLENAVALGEKLYPAFRVSLSGASYLVKAIGFLVNNFSSLLPLIASLTFAFIAYNKQKIITWALEVKSTVQSYKWMLAETIKQNMIGKTTLLTKAAAIAQAIWNTAISATGIGGMIILLGSLISILALATNAFNSTTKAQKALNEAKKETNDQMADEKAKIEVLKDQINNENLSREERNKKLKELISISPEYLDKLTLENIKTAQGTNIIKNYLSQLEKKIHLQNLEKKLADADKDVEEAKTNPGFWKTTWNFLTGGLNGTEQDARNKVVADAKKNYDDIWNEIQNYISDKPIDTFLQQKLNLEQLVRTNEISKEEYKQRLQEINDIQKTASDSVIEETEKQRKAREKAEKKAATEDKKLWEKEIKDLEDNLKQKQAINEKAFTEKIIKEEQYNSINLEDELKFNEQKLAVLKKHKQNTGEVELDIAKTKAQIQKQGYSQEIKLLEDSADEYKLNLEKKLNNGQLSQEEYNITLIAFELAQMQKRLAIQKKYGDNTIVLETEIERKKRELHQAMAEESENNTQKSPALSENSKLDIEEAELKSKYQSGLIAKQEYEKSMQEIAKKRWDNEFGFLEDYFDKANQATQDASTAVSAFKDADLTNAETTYNKDEEALKKKLDRGLISQEEYDSKKNALEEKYQNEQKAIKKKYAGVELAINIAKIISETALAVMKSYSASPLTFGLPWSAISAVAGAAQIASATAQYNQIQGLEEGLYPIVTRKQDGKKFKVNSVSNMQTGVYSQPSVLVGEAGPELVVDNKRFKKIMKDSPEVINYIVNGYEKGKYPSFSKDALNFGNDSTLMKNIMQTLNQLNTTINESDIYTLRKGLKKADKVIDYINNKIG